MVGILGSLSKIKYSYETIQPDKTIYFMTFINKGLFQTITSLTSSVWSWKAVHTHRTSPRNRWSRGWCCCINIRPYGWWIRSSAGISARNTFSYIGIRIAMFIWRIISCRWNWGPGKGIWGAIILYSRWKTCKIKFATLDIVSNLYTEITLLWTYTWYQNRFQKHLIIFIIFR